MKKKLNEIAIVNELRGASSFFPKLPTPARAQPNASSERQTRTVFANGQTERSKRTGETNGETVRKRRTVRPFRPTEKLDQAVFVEFETGTVEEHKRKTKRYSFEIYLDQEEMIKQLKVDYRAKMGKKLSGSRLIREALDLYFQNFKES